jgi:hypothetical protein
MIYIQPNYLPAPDFTHARIGYQNLTYGTTPVASSSTPGHPAIAATYPTTYEFWQPSSLPATWSIDLVDPRIVDYVGIVGDIEGAGLAIESSEDGTTWAQIAAEDGITDRINMFLFEPRFARFFRVVVSGVAAKIAVVYMGQALAMQRPIYQGHTPLNLSRETELSNNMSEGGQYLGRSIIRMGAKTSASWSHLRADWYRANFDPFVRAAITAPFFVAWRPAKFANELGFCWTDADISPSNTGPRDFMSVDMNFKGLINV